MRVFTYVQVNDGGSAPNYEPPAVTLAVCKPRIRLKAQPGDLVIAFSGRTLGANPHGVRWAGVVAEKLSFDEYWADKRFAGKKPDVSATPDNIYRPSANGLEQVPNVTHGPDSHRTDKGGQYALVFASYWRFGAAAPVIPQQFGLRMTIGRRGHRVHELSGEAWVALRAWLSDQRVAPSRGVSPRARNIRRTNRCS